MPPLRRSASATLRPADPTAIADVVTILRNGGLVAFPTETVYGLGADATNPRAVAGLYEAKGRPSFNPLIAHVADLEKARSLGVFNRHAERLADAFWPGPLTLVLPRTADCPVAPLASAGLPTVAIRIPRHPVAQELLRGFGRPVVAPSANRSGRLSPTQAAHVAVDLGDRIDLILDGGPTELGLESTVVACGPEGVHLLRPGGITADDLARVLGQAAAAAEGAPERPHSPGQLASHYAPRKPLRMNADATGPGEVLLGFGSSATAGAAALNLSRSGDLREAAANLFSYLHNLDESDAATIAVMPIPEHGLGVAINDRLRRAAAPRPD